MRFKNSPICRDRVLGTVDGIGRVYGFLDDAGLDGLVACDADDSGKILKRLNRHVEILDGLVEVGDIDTATKHATLN